MFDVVFCRCSGFTCLSKTHYLSRHFVIALNILQVCDRLKGYQDTGLASVSNHYPGKSVKEIEFALKRLSSRCSNRKK